MNLNYLVIVQPGGLPLFAQSFNFNNDKECQTFNDRVENTPNGKKLLLGGYFDAIKSIGNEVVEDQLKSIDLVFETYHITGMNFEDIFFIGIFESKIHQQDEDQIKNILKSIANFFINKYPPELRLQNPVNFTFFEKFLQDVNLPLFIDQNRNCLNKCKDINKGCLPHLIYFDDIYTSPNDSLIRLSI
ncbi:MAG: hypothetical protein ACXAC7_13150 [Candidatus Hodarchaeales archaeon]|jgi:hypothetical protein